MSLIKLGPASSTVASVANEFLALGEAECGKIPAIDQMKLQKLLFYAHAWHLAYYNAPLFDEDFEAWPWGPVVRDIYSQTVKYGRFPVMEKIEEITPSNGGAKFTIPDGVDNAELKKFIKEIWDVHKRFTGIQLSNSTHAKGEPWTIIKEQYGSLEGKPTIPNQLIASIYKAKISDENTPSQ